jgi:predicted Rossmann fold flavoprotein
VTKIVRIPDSSAGFVVHHSHGALTASRVILATGGRSIPKSGSDGFGYELARRLGHHVTPTVPALAPLVLDDRMFHKNLSGLSQEVELITVVKGKTLDARSGSLLWTHFGISGPVVMDASRFWCLAQEQREPVEVYGNFLPGQNQEQLRQWFMEQARDNPRRSLGKTFAQRFPQRFTESLIQHAGCDSQTAIAQLPKKDRDHLLSLLTKCPFPIAGSGMELCGGDGGVPLEEVNFRTMESKLVPGLYLAGEILDCDGRIGGFNFQWAWATGHLAGQAVGGHRSRDQSHRTKPLL